MSVKIESMKSEINTNWHFMIWRMRKRSYRLLRIFKTKTKMMKIILDFKMQIGEPFLSGDLIFFCSERIVNAEKRILEVKEALELFKADLEDEEARLTDLIRTKRSARASCSKDVAVAFLNLFPIER